MPTAEENQGARDWLHANVKPSTTALGAALANAQADGYSAAALGLAASGEVAKPIDVAVIGKAETQTLKEYWDAWKPGDVAAADLLHDHGFQSLLADQDVTIKGIADTTLDRMGTLMADGAAKGLSVDEIANQMYDLVGDMDRAYTIADTELARAVSQATADTFAENGIDEWDWLTSDGACEDCIAEEDSNPHSLGDLQPPAHPTCRCAMSPRSRLASEEPTTAEDTEAERTEDNFESDAQVADKSWYGENATATPADSMSSNLEASKAARQVKEGKLDAAAIPNYANAGYAAYTGDDYQEINAMLRGQQVRDVDQAVRLNAAVDAYYEEAGVALDQDTIFVRGVAETPDWQPSTWKVGSVEADNAWVSMTADESVAESYAKAADGEVWLMKIRMPKGSKVFYGDTGIHEVVAPRGSMFRVVSVDKETHVVQFEYVPR